MRIVLIRMGSNLQGWGGKEFSPRSPCATAAKVGAGLPSSSVCSILLCADSSFLSWSERDEADPASFPSRLFFPLIHHIVVTTSYLSLPSSSPQGGKSPGTRSPRKLFHGNPPFIECSSAGSPQNFESFSNRSKFLGVTDSSASFVVRTSRYLLICNCASAINTLVHFFYLI